MFTGEDVHIRKFPAQCGAAKHDACTRLRLFPLLLSKTAFTLYANLLVDLIHNWDEMEREFHAQFYSTVLEVTIANLATVRKYNNESVYWYIARFKKLRNRCLALLNEKEVKDLALDGLKFALRERLEGHHFSDLFQLIARAAKYENLWKKKDEKSYKVCKQNVALVNCEDDFDIKLEQGEAIEIVVANMILDKPYVSWALEAARVKETVMARVKDTHRYAFYITKLDEIFHLLLEDGLIKLTEGQIIPSKEELANKKIL